MVCSVLCLYDSLFLFFLDCTVFRNSFVECLIFCFKCQTVFFFFRFEYLCCRFFLVNFFYRINCIFTDTVRLFLRPCLMLRAYCRAESIGLEVLKTLRGHQPTSDTGVTSGIQILRNFTIQRVKLWVLQRGPLSTSTRKENPFSPAAKVKCQLSEKSSGSWTMQSLVVSLFL